MTTYVSSRSAARAQGKSSKPVYVGESWDMVLRIGHACVNPQDAEYQKLWGTSAWIA